MGKSFNNLKGLDTGEKKGKVKYQIGTSVRIPSLAVISRHSATAQAHLLDLLKYGPGYTRKNAAEPTHAELRSVELNPETFPVLGKAELKNGKELK